MKANAGTQRKTQLIKIDQQKTAALKHVHEV